MGRHTDGAGASTALRRIAQVSGLTGGVAWVGTAFLDAGGARDALFWVGAVLLTVALFGLGLLLVKSDVLVLRIFVALALPTLVWGVVSLLRDAFDEDLVDAVFGALVAVISAVRLRRRRDGGRATL